MVESVGPVNIQNISLQNAQPGSGVSQSQQPSVHSVDLFEHMLGNFAQEPHLVDTSAMARMLANPKSLGDKILSHVDKMHQAYEDMSIQVENRLRPSGAEQSGFSNAVYNDTNSPFSSIPVSSQPAQSVGPAAQPLLTEFKPDSAMGADKVNNGLTTEYDQLRAQVQDALWMQYNVGRVMVHESMMSKMAGKSTRNLDMLLRGQ